MKHGSRVPRTVLVVAAGRTGADGSRLASRHQATVRQRETRRFTMTCLRAASSYLSCGRISVTLGRVA